MDTTIPSELQAKALEEVTIYLNALWLEVSGQDATTEQIRPATEAWLTDLIRQLMPVVHEQMPDFGNVNHDDFRQRMIEMWMFRRTRAQVLRGENSGLSRETAAAIVKHLSISLY